MHLVCTTKCTLLPKIRALTSALHVHKGVTFHLGITVLISSAYTASVPLCTLKVVFFFKTQLII